MCVSFDGVTLDVLVGKVGSFYSVTLGIVSSGCYSCVVFVWVGKVCSFSV